MERKLTFFAAICFVLICSSISQATIVFGFVQTDLENLTKYGEDPAGQTLSYIAVDPDAVYGSMLGDVGFMGTLTDLTIPISPEIMIGTGSEDLTGYDEFRMTIFNDNDDVWTVQLYVDDGGTIITSSSAALAFGESADLSLDITSLGAVDSVGFVISSDRNDTFHISTNIIPEPTTICLLSLGAFSLFRKRKSA